MDRHPVIAVRKFDRHPAHHRHGTLGFQVAGGIDDEEGAAALRRFEMLCHRLVRLAKPGERPRVALEVLLRVARHAYGAEELAIGRVVPAGQEVVLYLLGVLPAAERGHDMPARVKMPNWVICDRSCFFSVMVYILVCGERCKFWTN
jgi:hypothetical protein